MQARQGSHLDSNGPRSHRIADADKARLCDEP